MGDGNGTALGYLLFKQGDDAPAATEDVAKAHGHELGLAGAVKALGDELGDALGGAHHAGGVDGLVGRHKHKTLCFGTRGGLG
ncbi:MAG: hypothetical protein DDT38_01652 [Firmicutes bacterium]|nr:hypothetical protein [candidate division NPL-UPA2 bacterium]